MYRRLVRIRNVFEKKIKSSLFYWRISYLTGLIYSRFCNNSSVSPASIIIKKDIKRRVLIIYSKSHFNPDLKTSEAKFSKSSAGNIARSIHEALFDNNDVIYVDQGESIREFEGLDLIIGIISKNFIEYCKRYPQAKRILFLVNSHPLFRIKELIKESIIRRKPLSYNEYTSPFIFFRAASLANKCLLIGNNFVKDTYLKFNFPEEKLHLMQSGANIESLIPKPELLSNKKVNFVYVASELGLRKGLFRTMDFWNKLNDLTDPTTIGLSIIGASSSFQNEIKAYCIKHKNVIFHGWVNSTEDRYREILQSSNIVINFSLEEGQVGAVLEAMSCGCVPIITDASGIPLPDDTGILIKDFDQEISSLVQTTLLLLNNPDKLKSLRDTTRRFIIKNYDWKNFKSSLHKYLAEFGY